MRDIFLLHQPVGCWTLREPQLRKFFVGNLQEGKILSAEELSKIEEERNARRKRAAKINPEYKLGETAFREKLYDKAVDHFRKSIRNW